MTWRNAILLTSDIEGQAEPHWELGSFSLRDGLGAIVGWTVVSEEGGVPRPVALTFARAMTRYGRLTFPCSTIANAGPGWREVRAPGDDHALLTKSGAITLLSTLEPHTVTELMFEDPYFQWWNTSQFGAVTRPPEKLPSGVCDIAAGLLEKDWARAAAQSGADIVMRSGVDGDVCGLAFASSEIRRAFEEMLAAAAAENGLTVRTVAYADFAQSLPDA